MCTSNLLKSLLQAHARDGRGAFFRAHGHPFLCFQRPPAEELCDESDSFGTMTLAQPDLDTIRGGDLRWLVPLEWPKRGRILVTVGRARNNDVEVSDPHVSKFHANLIRVSGRWYLVDANSRNGTVVDQVELAPRRLTPLRPGARVVLGRTVPFVFLEPEQLYEQLGRGPISRRVHMNWA